MSSGERNKVRLELARGHWSLGERDEAVTCLERLADEAAEAEGLLPLVEELQREVESAPLSIRLEELGRRLESASDASPSDPEALSPLATPTMAELLAEQGHEQEALAVTEDLLRHKPDDPRALAMRRRLMPDAEGAIARLERWLGHVQRLTQGAPRA